MTRIFSILVGLSILFCLENSPCISTISAEKEVFGAADSISISYRIQNISKDTVDIWHCGFWCNNIIIVTDQDGTELPRTEWGKATLKRFDPGGARDRNFPITLAPMGIDSAYDRVNLRDLFRFGRSGVYHVSYYYEEHDERGKIKIKSNVLKIRVTD